MRIIAAMLTFLHRLLVAVITLLILVFIASNRQEVSLTLFPLPFAWQVPLFVPTFAVGALGLIAGFLLAATPLLPERFRTWRHVSKLKAEKQALEQELAIMKLHAKESQPASSVLPFHAAPSSHQLRPAQELFASKTPL